MTSDDESPRYPHLFSRLSLGRVTLKNRIVHAAMSTRFQAGGKVTDQLIAYHANRAQGGAAISVTEPLGVIAQHVGAGRVDVYSNQDGEGLRRWAQAFCMS